MRPISGTVAAVLRTARRAGATTIHNPAPMRADFDPALLRHVNILIPNESEFAALITRQKIPGAKKLTAAAVAALPSEKLHALAAPSACPPSS